jgi:hypothetical protein
MNEILAIWAEWIKPSAGLPTVQWSILLALAAAAGHLLNRYTGMPKVVGYSLVGGFAGLAGFSGAVWPLQGTGLFLLELGVAVVLFEAGGRIPLRWFRHNPMVLVQSLAESALTFILVYWALQRDERARSRGRTAGPAGHGRLAGRAVARGHRHPRRRPRHRTRAGAVHAQHAVRAHAVQRPRRHDAPPRIGVTSVLSTLYPVLVVLGLSVVVGAVLALTLRTALRVMSPTSENTAILLLALIAAGAALAAHFGGSAPLAALLGGMLLKQLNPRPWSWPRQMGTASSMLTMLMFVLVSVVAAQADWSGPVAGLVIAWSSPAWWPRSPASPSATSAAAPAGSRPCGWAARCRRCPRSRCCWCRSLPRPRAPWAARSPRRPARHPADGSAGRGAGHRGHLPRRRKFQTLGAAHARPRIRTRP